MEKKDMVKVTEGMAWDGIKKVKLAKKQLAGIPEIKGIEIWAAPFKGPDKECKKKFEPPKNEVFVIHLVTWGRKFLARLNEEKTALAEILEIK